MVSKEKVASAIEHTCLKPFAVVSDIHQICQEALEWGLYGVCIAPIWLQEAKTFLGSAKTRLITVAAFPTGAVSTATKCYELEEALKLGAHEVDIVLNIGWIKEHRFRDIEQEFRQLTAIASDIPVKAILETCYLTDEEKKQACKAVVAAGASFVKTSTGFGSGGATIADVILLSRLAPQVKASGGIKETRAALDLLEAGASRLGSSSSVAIMKSL